MKNLFGSLDNRELIERIQRLSLQSPRAWGKMSVAQMLAHCRQPLRVATGELELKRGLAGLLFGKLAKRKLAGPKPFEQGLPTHPKFVVRDPKGFDEERAALIALVQRFGDEGPAVLARLEHPFFGPMTVEEWNQLQWKHLDHHLRQFGA